MLPEFTVFGFTISLYVFFNLLSTFSIVLYILVVFPCYFSIQEIVVSTQKARIKTVLKAIIPLVFMLLFGFVLFRLLNPLFAALFTEGNANYYGNLLAWAIALAVSSIVFHSDPLRIIDLFSPAIALELVFAKMGCFFAGCCHSFEANTFYFNQVNQRYEFPVQLVEAAVALLLFVLLLAYLKKCKYPGTLLPLYFSLYGLCRFGTEFLRDDLPNCFGPFNAYQIMSVVFLATGVMWFLGIRKFGKTIEKHLVPREWLSIQRGSFVRVKARG